jgi:hypothetical protein
MTGQYSNATYGGVMNGFHPGRGSGDETLYDFRVISRDANGNQTNSANFTFTTAR